MLVKEDTIKTKTDIEYMRAAGKLASQTLDMIEEHVVSGITTQELDDLCDDFFLAGGGISACIDYNGYPKSTCISPNHVVCHGVPGKKKLKDGDIINIDVTVILDGWFGDTSRMYYVGKPKIKAQKICELAKDAMWAGIEQVKPGNTTGDVGYAIETFCKNNKVNTIDQFCGHGIGQFFHGDIQTPSYGVAGTGNVFKVGTFVTIEPILTLGKDGSKILNDNWTIVTRDRALSAQWEHTLAITEDGYEIMTMS